MDTLEFYRQIVKKIISDYATISYRHGQIDRRVVFDDRHNRYLLIAVGWDGIRRVHDCTIHAEIINGKIWIEWDGIEEGMAIELLKAGVPKEDIVLGFRSPQMRKLTDFALS